MKITISSEEYQKLSSAYEKLQALESFGVDNWEGYDMAMEQYNLSNNED